MMETLDPRELWSVLNKEGMEGALDAFEKLYPRREGASDDSGEATVDNEDLSGPSDRMQVDGEPTPTAEASVPASSLTTEALNPPGSGSAAGAGSSSLLHNATRSRLRLGLSRMPLSLSGRANARIARRGAVAGAAPPRGEIVYERKYKKNGKWKSALFDLFSELVEMDEAQVN